ncbi:hypothetical protein I350_05113 [Cryptococcus amylolentus CBS 6273]|uniref:Conserved oligomeric Golgi complex subunit 1 n=1 Tax=Cryptococcus amylolentus CBS 6273 TaxID=1296118 RepID=A0A1E3JUJ2_9TREE|nr:hypothetical protein I350_05113 [Cryptococcus amylolentus CBS 6273]
MPPRQHPAYHAAPSYPTTSPHEHTHTPSSSHRSTPVSPAASRHSRHPSQSSSFSQRRGKGSTWGKGDVPPVPALPDYARRYSEKSAWSLPPVPGAAAYSPLVGGTSTADTLRGSTPYRRRRRQNKDPLATPGTPGTPGSGGGADGEDWAEVEPDEVFRRLPVGEVKRIEAKMRSEALGKQSELRSMVGTRYRDLLTSASQITTLRSSSLRLSDNLKKVVSGCTDPTGLGDGAHRDGTDDDAASNTSEGEEVVHMLPAAAHMKLLLDAPEALYALLGSKNFLQASFLWLISRSTKESLSSLPPAQSAPYLHLFGKQWELLAPLRGAIAQRAGESLKNWQADGESSNSSSSSSLSEKEQEKEVAECLLGLVLVEGLGVGDALASFLNQRAKAVKEILNHPSSSFSSSSKRQSLSPQTSRRSRARTNSLLSQNPTNPTRERESIAKTLVSAVKCLLQTAQTARAVFGPRASGSGVKEGKESLFEEMIRLVQKGESSAGGVGVGSSPLKGVQTQAPASGHASKHQRRTSRLLSISLPLPVPQASSSTTTGKDAQAHPSRPPISAPQTLLPLPSSQILLRHLPNPITSFTPFITPGPPVDTEAVVQAWERGLVGVFRQEVGEGWLGGLKSVRDVWFVREKVLDVLRSFSPGSTVCGEFEKTLESGWTSRVESVWDENLASLVTSIHSTVLSGATEYNASDSDSGAGGDKDPQGWLLQEFELPFDNLPTSSSLLSLSSPPSASGPSGPNTTTTAYKTFLTSLRARAQLRTPLLDTVLSKIEALAKAMREDLLVDLPPALRESYGRKVGGVWGDVVGALERVLEQVGAGAAEGGGVIEGEGEGEGEGGGKGEGKAGKELFVGRVALYLSEKSVFLQDLAGETVLDREKVQKSLLNIHARSTQPWQKARLTHALSLLGPLFSPLRTDIEITAFWPTSPSPSASHAHALPASPSQPIIQALSALAKATTQLGIPSDVMERVGVVRGLLEEFIEGVVGLPGWGERLALLSSGSGSGPGSGGGAWEEQAIVDIAFLLFLTPSNPLTHPVIQRLLLTLPPASRAALSESLQGINLQTLRQSQLLLHPLTLHLSPASVGVPNGPESVAKAGGGGGGGYRPDKNAFLLRFGAPVTTSGTGAGGSEFRSPVPVGKIGKRMGLLSLAV